MLRPLPATAQAAAASRVAKGSGLMSFRRPAVVARALPGVASRRQLPVPCRDDDCGHRACDAYRDGYREGFEEGAAAGFAAGMAAAQSGCSCGG